MPNTILLPLLLLLLLPAGAHAQVYKCKGKSGETMYSEHPCDARAEPMKLREDRVASTAAGTGTEPPGQPPTEAAPAATAGAGTSADGEANRAAERACIATATASIYGSSNDRVGTLQQQMAMLNDQLAAATTAERSQALRGRMATFRQAITREHANAQSQLNTARRACAEQHRPAAMPAR